MREAFHFLGVGGIGMSALAHLLVEKGEVVSGTDKNEAVRLKQCGVKFTKDLPSRGTIVYSSAISEDNPLFIEAKKSALPMIHRSLLVKTLLKGKEGILVAGTHGKTSTSALLSWTLISADYNPSFAVGGILQNLSKNGGYGAGKHLVLEADESDGSFLNYSGEGAIITNIEKEHLENWKTEEKLIEGFKSFIKGIKNPNLTFYCNDDPILKKLAIEGISYGKSGDLKLLSYDQKGLKSYFSCGYKGKVYQDIELPLLGEVLALNALAVFGMALELGVQEEEIRKAFKTFKGVKRRQEKVGECERITIYDDYAHHPTEIKALLKSFKKGFKKRRLVALFQPHRYSRTRDLFSEFKGAFEDADLTIITDIYSAGEEPICGVTSRKLVKDIHDSHTLFLEKDKLVKYAPKLLIPGDVLVTLGAGDITKLGPEILKGLS